MRHGKIDSANNTYGSQKNSIRSPKSSALRKGIAHQAQAKFSSTVGNQGGFQFTSPLLGNNEQLSPTHMKSTFHQHTVRMSPSGNHHTSFNNQDIVNSMQRAGSSG
jgi:hypothetical protein